MNALLKLLEIYIFETSNQFVQYGLSDEFYLFDSRTLYKSWSRQQVLILTVITKTLYFKVLRYLIGRFNLLHVGTVSNNEINISIHCNVPKQ